MPTELPPTTDDETARRVDVTVVRSARRRSLALQVDRLGQVEVRVPLHADPGEIRSFLDRHRGWLLRKLADVQANPPWRPVWAEGGEWYWQGATVRLAAGGPRGGQLAEGVLHLPLRAGDAAEKWERAVFNWHRREAAVLLHARAAELFAVHCAGHQLAAIHLRWMRATWGTCSGRRHGTGPRTVKLRLNPWLASLPPALSDAILLHELAHVEHMNHGARFYRRLGQINPAWREHDQALQAWARRLFPIAAR